DPALGTNPGRLEQRDRIVSAFAERLATQPARHWTERLAHSGVPSGVVRTVLEALRDGGASPLTGVAPSVPGHVRFAPPVLGEHTDMIRRHAWGVFKIVTPLGAERR